MAGYSKTPLHKKLGLKDDLRALVINAPENYATLLGPDQPAPHWISDLGDKPDFVHFFSTERVALEAFLAEAMGLIARNGMIWVSWPKKASKVPTTITEDVIREVCLPMGLVDVKVCAVDDIWSGLKLVIRKELR